MSILVTVYKFATGQFAQVPLPMGRPQDDSNPPQLKYIPNAPVS